MLVKHRVKTLLNSLIRHKRVALFHTGRCGSTVLASMLRQHPDWHWGGELFEKYMSVLPKQKIDSDFVRRTILTSECASVSPIYGFETKYLPQQHLSDNCLNMKLSAYVNLLNSIGFNYFITLHRRNYLKRAISVQVAMERGSWHSTEKPVSLTPVYINLSSVPNGCKTQSMLDLFDTIEKSYSELKECLSSTKYHLSLTYEDDIEQNPITAYNKICEFLNVSLQQPQVKLQRINPFPNKDVVQNWEEICGLLKDTQYSWMLRE